MVVGDGCLWVMAGRVCTNMSRYDDLDSELGQGHIEHIKNKMNLAWHVAQRP